MRAVTFSTPKVNKAMNEHFVNTFSNTEGDPTAGQSIRHSPDEQAGTCTRGNGQQNVQTIFMTPDEEILHTVTGYIDADELLNEMDFALRLFNAQSESSEPQMMVSNAHRERMLDAGFSEDEVENRSPFSGVEVTMRLPTFGEVNGSGSRETGQSSTPFSGFTRRAFLTDNKFSMNYPLISRSEFEQDPGLMVGNGTSFFSSSSNSSGMPGSMGIRMGDQKQLPMQFPMQHSGQALQRLQSLQRNRR